MAEAALELKGLALPAVRTAGGYFAVRDRYDVAWGDLLLAIMTPIGSRPMRRQFGSALHLVVDDPNDPTALQRADYAIRDAASSWCPHIVVRDVQLAISGKGIRISVAFSLKGDSQVTNRTLQASSSQFQGS